MHPPKQLNKKQIQTHYDNLSSNYWKLYGDEQTEKHHLLLREFKPNKSQTILDAGCGNGALSRLLSRKSRMTVGLDLSFELARIAHRLNIRSGRCDIVQGDAEHLPLKGDSLHAFIAISVVLRPNDVEDTLKEVKRVLVVDGVAIISILRKTLGCQSTASMVKRGFQGWHLEKIQIGRDVGFRGRRAVLGRRKTI